MSSITLDPVTKERDNLNNCGAAEYAAQCDEGVTAQDQKCSEQCALYKKRAQAPATGDLCKANPVQATSPAFKDGFCEKYSDNEGQQKYKVSCTVTATCTCDP